MTVHLKLTGVDKFYGAIGKGVHAVQNIDMDVTKGEIIALLGSSGCGKTSTLRMIAGFEETSRGTIELAGREVQSLPPVRRNVAMAFEGYSLYPTVTVGENIAFALKAAKLPTAEVDAKVKEVTEMLEITDILHRRFPNLLILFLFQQLQIKSQNLSAVVPTAFQFIHCGCAILRVRFQNMSLQRFESGLAVEFTQSVNRGVNDGGVWTLHCADQNGQQFFLLLLIFGIAHQRIQRGERFPLDLRIG